MNRRGGIRTAAAISAIVCGVALCGTVLAGPPGGGRPADAGKAPWSDVIRDADGNVLKATGRGEGRVPLSIAVSRDRLDGRPGTTTTYVRGNDTLLIERVYDPERGMSLAFRTIRETWQVSLSLDPLTGEGQARYELDGRSFALWVGANGQVAGGDLEGLREVLFSRSPIAELMRHYLRDRAALGSGVPAAAETAIIFSWVDQEPCRDECSLGCELQCAYECNLTPFHCQICKTACAAGCAIGCSL